MECFRLLLEHLAWIEHQFLSGIWDSRKAGSLWGMMRSVGRVRKSIHQSWLAKGLGLGLGLRCGGFKKSSGQHSSNGVSGISTRTMHQFTIPSLSPTIWPRWASRLFLSLPIVQTLLPVTYGYSLSSEAVVIRQLRRWKRLWRRSLTRSHKRTSMGPSRSYWNGTSALQPEEITSKGTNFMRVLWIKKSKLIVRKKSKLIVCTPYIYIYIYIYMCVCVCVCIGFESERERERERDSSKSDRNVNKNKKRKKDVVGKFRWFVYLSLVLRVSTSYSLEHEFR